MRVCDESTWQLQRSELLADGEVGQQFLTVLEAWVGAAEELLDAAGTQEYAGAINMALGVMEQKYGPVSIGFLAQMLVVIASFWEHGDQLVEGLSAIELRLIQEVAAVKIATLMAEADDAEAAEAPV